MGDLNDLELIVKSRIPLVVVESHEESRVLDLCRQVAFRVKKPVYSWTVTEGLDRIDLDMPANEDFKEPADILKHIKINRDPSVFVLIDFHPYLEDPVNKRLVKEIALNHHEVAHNVVFISHHMDIDSDLRKLSARFELQLPDRDALVQIVKEEAYEYSKQNNSQKVQTSQSTLDRLVTNLTGLTASDARRLARKVIFNDGALDASDIPAVQKAKYELLDQGSLLSFEYETEKFADVGGMANLKQWLNKRKKVIMDPDSGRDLDPPKGILLLGVQGCGKSLTAKAVAGIFAVPLLRLDFGALYNKYYGESEKNLREALKTADVMSPCVLWIDELEKGMTTGDQDDGVSQRILGTILTWMSDRESRVFMVATANDIEALPPELVRKGRFDEIFFVDLPKPDVRQDIFRIHLKKRGFNPDDFDLEKLKDVSEGFSGAEIEQAIVSSLYAVYGETDKLDTTHILEEIERTRPLSVVMAEKIAALRAWAQDRTVPAD